MKSRKKAEEIAVQRMQWLSPLLADGLDAAKVQQLKTEICGQTGFSERTLRRWKAQYQAEGFEGLKPKGKGRPRYGAIPPDLLEQAILLRREVPRRSIRQIIQILEWEGRAQPGQLKRSTLQEKLTEHGYSARHMRLYADTGVAARRYQRRHRNQLWSSDIKYGPYLPIGPGGKKQQVYLVAMLDDATRFVVHGAFYPTQDQTIVEDCFRQSIQKHGAPDTVYFDNGTQYRNRWMVRTCSKLGIRLLYTRPYSPESKGKIERFNQTVDAFLAEVSLEKPQTLEQLNERFAIWLSECYQYQPHAALGKDISPDTAFRSDTQPLRFVDAENLKNAFLHAETRKVDKSGCISFLGRKYEVGLMFVGRTVDMVYDPSDLSELTIEYEGHTPWTARPLHIGERTGKRPSLPGHMTTIPADASRLLDAAERKHQKRQEQQTPAVSYRSAWKEADADV